MMIESILYIGSLRIDVDVELMQHKFSSSPVVATAWVESLAEQINSILLEQANTRLTLATTKTWLHSDPFGSTADSFQALLSYEAYITQQYPEHTVAILLSGAGETGETSKGVAMQDSACNFGVAVVYVPWEIPDWFSKARTLDLSMHEIGHTFDLDHTHCQSHPLDQCWSGGGFLGQFGATCYTGPTSCPAQGFGTAMSICSESACQMDNNPMYHDQLANQLRQIISTQKTCLERTFHDSFE